VVLEAPHEVRRERHRRRGRRHGGDGKDPLLPHRGTQGAEQRQELVVAVVHRLHVHVDAVEALVHEAPALGDDPLPLAEVREVDGSRTLPLVADAQAAHPGENPQLGGRPARGGEEGPHLLPAVHGEAPRPVEGDEVGIGVGDPMA
jgi:hypothetical protein